MAKRDKNFNYFSSFERMGNFSYQAAEMLQEILENYDSEQLPQKVKEMHVIEHAADIEHHDMLEHLSREFITPIEREDIIHMGQELDEVTDCMEDVVLNTRSSVIQEVPDKAQQMAAIITKCCTCLNAALKEFANFKKSTSIKDRLIEINRLEEDGDEIYIEGNRELYVSCTDPMTIYAWSATYTRLEKCCDACEHVADTMEMIIMKNS